MKAPVLPVDRCRICGCGGDACRLEDGDLCVWMSERHDCCSNPRCVLAAVRADKDAKRKLRDEKRDAVKPIRDRTYAAQTRRRAETEKSRKRRMQQIAKFRGAK